MKKRQPYQEEFDLAARILAPHGGALERADHAYEAFRYVGDGVALIFYPHRTTAGNYHVRVRDQHSKDGARAAEMMKRLYRESGFNCTFSFKKLPA